jgi:hypothetical protein
MRHVAAQSMNAPAPRGRQPSAQAGDPYGKGGLGRRFSRALRTSAQAGVWVLIGAETYRQLPDGAAGEPVAGLRVKGKAGALDAYLLHSLDACHRHCFRADAEDARVGREGTFILAPCMFVS